MKSRSRVGFQHDAAIWRDFPELVPGVMFVEGITPDVEVEPRIAVYEGIARERLAGGTEPGFPETQAWRPAFSRMGLNPTRYLCAEALLLRFPIPPTLSCSRSSRYFAANLPPT
jgi:DNA/RNA-binding domain of Phe-tRNA-synthetase-like protein